jgi:coenzyme F420-reducing hydrogenase beta subunit
MNNITKKGDNSCCSCGMCAVTCRRNAVTLKRNKDGFYAPAIDVELCTDCGICLKVCYQYLKRKDIFKNAFEDKHIYAAWSKNPDTVMTCSSGGAGYELTSYFYDKGYNICGVIFDASNDNCKHIIAHTREDLEAIKTSKYLQSYTVGAFSQFKEGEKYLVIGTPCQIYGLRKWIQMKKQEDNFILVDFFCEGTPSFNLWVKYKDYLSRKTQLGKILKNVCFRFKDRQYRGATWHKNAMLLRDISDKTLIQPMAFNNNLFFKLFLNVSCLNTSCYECQLRMDGCAADIRIADFWGEKYAERNDGVSLVIANTEKGQTIWDEIRHCFDVEECSFEDLMRSQTARYHKENKRDITLAELRNADAALEDIYNQYHRPVFIIRMLKFAKKVLAYTLKNILGKSLFNKLKKRIYEKK